ncbi:MAG: CCA tRNA nucleotidyltransferase [Methanobacteriaceae archaeon]
MPDLNKVLQKIQPSLEEKAMVENLASELIKIINQEAQNQNIPAKAILVGSVAKGTRLAGKSDVDIFITFPLDCSQDYLKQKGLELGHYCIKLTESKFEERYASHPYVTGFIGGYEVDFVPCYDIHCGEELKSAVDRTVLHTKYIKANLKPQQQGEVLLLKRFMQVVGCYGSEFKVGGFPGYLAELLILEYETFLNVLKAAAIEWMPGYQLDLEKYGTASHFHEPLVVVDPVDKNRNVAAALTLQKMAEFVVAASQYLKTPSQDYFSKKDQNINLQSLKDDLLSRGTEILILSFPAPKIPEDALFPQIRKTEHSLVNILKRGGFRVWGSDSVSYNGQVFIILELEVYELPSYRKHYGPQIWNRVHSQSFQEKYQPHCWLEGDTWVALVRREHTTAASLLKYVISRDGIRHLRTGRHLKDQLLHEYELRSLSEFIENTDQDQKVWGWLNHYLHKNEFPGDII